ncbi:hypothetical protein C8R45DRAFT_948142 [Mycena sanguinolenta]|nr:hypothetical protein C8R45DRAFT_948142 [Mycena sanguinolenta]
MCYKASAILRINCHPHNIKQDFPRFPDVVTTALNVFLTNTSAGQMEEKKYFIYMHHNAIVRLDVMLWRWKLENHGFSDTTEQVLGYVGYLSVVDIKVLKTSEFVYLLTEYASAAKKEGDGTIDFEKYCAEIGKVYKAARHLKASQRREMDDEEV